jgi:hypothetical protein
VLGSAFSITGGSLGTGDSGENGTLGRRWRQRRIDHEEAIYRAPQVERRFPMLLGTRSEAADVGAHARRTAPLRDPVRAMSGALLALTLVLHPSQRESIEKWASGAFANQQEATNFSAHVGWSLALPLAGYAVADRKGLYVAGGAWLAYSLVNEFAMHGPENAHARRLDPISRLVPCTAVMLWTVVRSGGAR